MNGEDLDFQMAGRETGIIQEQASPKAEARFALGFFQRASSCRGVMDDAHATAAATHRCFHNEGIANLASDSFAPPLPT